MDNTTRSSVLVDADHPWLGLLSFREAHRRFFFGREREIADLHERARRNRLTVLFGPSGLGKTSILQAGLCPLLRENGALPVLIRLTYPGRETDAVQPPPLLTQIAEKIATALTDAGHDLPPLLADPTAITSLWALFHDTVAGLCHPAAPRIVLLIDQFEEIFTLGEDEARAKADAATLRDALADFTENRPPPTIQRQIDIEPELAERFDFDADPCRIVIVLREDYLARLERWRTAMPGLLRNRMEIRLLDGPRAFDAVAGPARLEGRNLVTDTVAADIVRAVAGATPGTPLDEIAAVPPLLSLLCAKLNELRLKNTAPQISADLLKISVRDILEDFYKSCFTALPSAAAVRETIETLLISPSGYRESPSADSVLSALRARGVASPAAALRHLEDERLITSEERGGIRRIEITHDVLAPLAHASRTAAQLRARRRKLVLWTVVPAAVIAAFCLPLTFWALREKGNAERQSELAEKAKTNAQEQTRIAESEKTRAISLIRFMDTQVGEAFTDVPVQLRERVSDRLDAFYRSQGEPTTDDERQRRMGHHYRKAMVHIASAAWYQEDKSINETTKKYFVEKENKNAAADLAAALRYDDIIAAAVPDDRRITRDRILAHHQLFLVLEGADAENHRRTARELRDTLVKDSPFPLAQWTEWMDLPDLDAPKKPEAPAK